MINDTKIKNLAVNTPLEYFVSLLRNLPDGMMEAHGLLIPFNNESEIINFFNEIRKLYRNKADWLSYYNGKSDLIEELTFTEKSLYKPFADISKAWLTIIQQTFLLSPDLKEEWKSPSLFWFLLETEWFQGMSNKSGLTNNANPTPKYLRYKLVIESTTYCNNPKNLLEKPEITTSPTSYFMSVGMELCSIQENVDFRKHWNNFLKEVKRCERVIERSELKVTYLDTCEIKQLDVARNTHKHRS